MGCVLCCNYVSYYKYLIAVGLYYITNEIIQVLYSIKGRYLGNIHNTSMDLKTSGLCNNLFCNNDN